MMNFVQLGFLVVFALPACSLLRVSITTSHPLHGELVRMCSFFVFQEEMLKEQSTSQKRFRQLAVVFVMGFLFSKTVTLMNAGEPGSEPRLCSVCDGSYGGHGGEVLPTVLFFVEALCMAVIIASILLIVCLLLTATRVATGLISLDVGGVLIQALTSLSGPLPEEVGTAVEEGGWSWRLPTGSYNLKITTAGIISD